jgi:hypothetical protein
MIVTKKKAREEVKQGTLRVYYFKYSSQVVGM